jgi:hypothetical protein
VCMKHSNLHRARYTVYCDNEVPNIDFKRGQSGESEP